MDSNNEKKKVECRIIKEELAVSDNYSIGKKKKEGNNWPLELFKWLCVLIFLVVIVMAALNYVFLPRERPIGISFQFIEYGVETMDFGSHSFFDQTPLTCKLKNLNPDVTYSLLAIYHDYPDKISTSMLLTFTNETEKIVVFQVTFMSLLLLRDGNPLYLVTLTPELPEG